MMMIAPNSRARKGGKERGEVKGKHDENWGEEEGITETQSKEELFNGSEYIERFVLCIHFSYPKKGDADSL